MFTNEPNEVICECENHYSPISAALCDLIFSKVRGLWPLNALRSKFYLPPPSNKKKKKSDPPVAITLIWRKKKKKTCRKHLQTVAVHSLDKTITDNSGNEVLVTIPNQDIPFNEVGSAVHVTGVDGIILRLQQSNAGGGGVDEMAGWGGSWLRDDGGQQREVLLIMEATKIMLPVIGFQ